MPTDESTYKMGRGTLSIEMEDGTRVTMNALAVSISDMTERMEHFSMRSGTRVPDGSVIINQEFRIEAVGPGLDMVFPEQPALSASSEAPESPLAGVRVERLPDSQELAKRNLMRVIRMNRRDDEDN